MPVTDDVRARAASGIEEMRAVAELFGAVWGRNADGVPIGSEMLQSIDHADGLVSDACTSGRRM